MQVRMIGNFNAWLPRAMSLTALAIVLLHIVRFGIVRQPDEGGDVHLFQLLMVVQLPIIAYFAIEWLPQAPQQAVVILALQAAAFVVTSVPVFVLEH